MPKYARQTTITQIIAWMRALLVISTNTMKTKTKVRRVRFQIGQDQAGNGANSELKVIQARKISISQGIELRVQRFGSREISQPPSVATAIAKPNGWPSAGP